MEAQFPILCAFTPLKPGSEKFQRIPITTNVFKLGRGQHNTVVIPYKCLSKDHCLFKKVEGGWLLENCSYSSIKVNGNKLCKGETHKLCDQDIIKLESSNELVYKFMSNTKSSKCKKRKLDNEIVQNGNNVKKSESTRSMRSDINKNLNDMQMKLKEQILLEQSKREKEIYDDYAVRIEKVKGSKKNVKHQKALLKMRRNAQLELNKVKMEERIASVMAQQTESNENKHSKDRPHNYNGQGDQVTNNQSEAKREQDRARMKEKRELKKLRRETRRLKLEKEKKLKELEKQKLRREKELQNELDKLNKKLAKERELHEKERRRAEQLLNQKKEELKKVSPSTSSESKLDMESELQCSICSELFVRATTLGCSHSFCRYCIRKWTANKKECPICRAAITSECRSIVLDSLVDKMAESADDKKRRQELVKARDELEAKEPTTTANRGDQNYLFDANFIRDFLRDSESSLEPDFDMLVPMDTDSERSGFDDSDVFSGRDENGESEYDEPENYDENSEHENEENYEVYSEESDRDNEEIYDEAPENEEEEHEGNSENDGQHVENYDEGENSPTDNEDHDENDPEYNEDQESASENYDEGETEIYDEGENSGAENYDEGDNSSPENYDEGENSGAENYDEGDNSSPDNYDEGENSAPEDYDEGENSAPENYDGDNTEPENCVEGENSGPENSDEGENSGPENYDEGDNSAPENYDEGDYSAPEYDGDSYTDDGGGDDDDYY
ncbi:E3 ubiquitin-protein ligase rnf8-A-like [Cydia pomonella]|uniref:E3 ubiquitin-protein ligase rnf8-A-like n=1 Tax=Cydia pomonella TaxID=82600 RepID=UPI002ADD6D30|nr:E3 ubiquitin-protein ligase rnf8-A-like [Cydia pomonella]